MTRVGIAWSGRLTPKYVWSSASFAAAGVTKQMCVAAGGGAFGLDSISRLTCFLALAGAAAGGRLKKAELVTPEAEARRRASSLGTSMEGEVRPDASAEKKAREVPEMAVRPIFAAKPTRCNFFVPAVRGSSSTSTST